MGTDFKLQLHSSIAMVSAQVRPVVFNHFPSRRYAVANGYDHFSVLGFIRVIVELFAYEASRQHQFVAVLMDLLKWEYW